MTAPAPHERPAGSSHPLRVALDGRDLAVPAARGMVRYVVGLAAALPAVGVRPVLFHRAREPLNPDFVRAAGCPAVPLTDLGGVFWEQVAVPAALAAGRFDLYHAPAERGVPLAAPCPVALTVHSATAASYAHLVRTGQLPGPVETYLGPAARAGPPWAAVYSKAQRLRRYHVFTPSAFAREELIRLAHYPAGRVSVTPLALPEGFARPPSPPDVRRATLARLGVTPPYLLFVGGFEPHKNPVGLLDVLAGVRRSRPDVTLVVVGSRNPTAAAAFTSITAARGLAVGREVVVLTDLAGELIDLYDGAVAFISLSWRESFGVPFLEAMARRLPVVASRWGAAPEVVGDAGELVDPRDAGAAVAAERCLDPVRRPGYTSRASARVGRFSWNATAARTVAVYHRLVSRRG
jgi:glycosyltransferase involved in cell wall biosynthesis